MDKKMDSMIKDLEKTDSFLEELKEKYFSEEEIYSHIRLEFPNPIGTKLVITKLFDNRYSLNYWGKKKSGDQGILIRKVIKVEIDKDELRIEEDSRFGFNEITKLLR